LLSKNIKIEVHRILILPVACMGAHRILVGTPSGRKPLGRPRCRWEDNIKMDQEVGLGGMDWIDLAQDGDRRRALVNMVRTLRVP
jgi:hypothetical protein